MTTFLLDDGNDELEHLVLEAFRDASNTGRLTQMEDIFLSVGNAIFEDIREEIEYYFELFDIVLDIQEPEDITQEHLDMAGITVPEIDAEKVEKILEKNLICFVDRNFSIKNHPQLNLLYGILK